MYIQINGANGRSKAAPSTFAPPSTYLHLECILRGNYFAQFSHLTLNCRRELVTPPVSNPPIYSPPELVLVLQHPFWDKAIAPAILICRPMPVVKQKWLIWNSFERSAHNFECQLDDIAGPAAAHGSMGISNCELRDGSWRAENWELRTVCRLSSATTASVLPLKLAAFVFVTRGMKLNFRPLTTKTQPIGQAHPIFSFRFLLLLLLLLLLLTQSPP